MPTAPSPHPSNKATVSTTNRTMEDAGRSRWMAQQVSGMDTDVIGRAPALSVTYEGHKAAPFNRVASGDVDGSTLADDERKVSSAPDIPARLGRITSPKASSYSEDGGVADAVEGLTAQDSMRPLIHQRHGRLLSSSASNCSDGVTTLANVGDGYASSQSAAGFAENMPKAEEVLYGIGYWTADVDAEFMDGGSVTLVVTAPLSNAASRGDDETTLACIEDEDLPSTSTPFYFTSVAATESALRGIGDWTADGNTWWR